MKTAYMVIIVSVIITISVIFALTFEYSFEKEYYDIEIHGMKDSYYVGDEYSFYYTLSGRGNTCGSWLVLYPDKDGVIQHNGAVVDCTSDKNRNISYDSRQDGRKFTSFVPEIEGIYNVTTSLENGAYVVYTFTVLPKSEYGINKDVISENIDPYTLYDITGLKQIYKVGEPISFTETIQGYANPCIFPHYEIIDGDTLEPVWEYKIVYPCPFAKDSQLFKKTNTIPDKNIPSPILNQTGSYILRSYHSYSDGYTVMTFSVVGNSFVQNTIDPCNVVYDLDTNDLQKRTAPPISVGEYGRDATLMEPFVFDTSIGKLSTPLYMPSCYELKSDKIKNDLRTLVFYPNDMAYNNDVTITKIIKEGVLILVSDTSETPEEWSASVKKSIGESPDISSTILKDHPVLLISGIPSKDMSSTVKMVIDDKQIQVISTKLDTVYLMHVLESMFEN